MLKVFGAHDQERLLAEVGQTATLITTNASIKSASSSSFTRELLDTYKPDKDHFLLHVTALGDDEHYGPNRNCWPAGTPVRTPAGFRAIETLKEGDLVLTHKGRYRPVTRLYRRKYDGGMVTLRAWNLARPVLCTEEHPLEVLRKEYTTVAKLNPKTKGRRQGAERIAANFTKATTGATFVEAHTVRPGDWLRLPAETVCAAVLPWDAWLLGLYVAEGCLVKEYKDITTKGEYKSLLFTLGVHDDADVIPRLRDRILELGRKFSVQESYTSEHGRRVDFGHKILAGLCETLFGGQASTKTVGASVFDQSVTWKLDFLAGLFDGDGCCDANGALVLSSASHDLVSSVQRLLSSCGITSSVSEGVNKVADGCFGKQDSAIFALQVGASFSNLIKERSARFRPHRLRAHGGTKARVANGELWVQVRDVVKAEAALEVFNIEVEEDHTYVTTVSGHNCDGWPGKDLAAKHATFVRDGHFYREHENRRKDQRIGSIKASTYDPKMGRVELIIHGALKPRDGEPLTAEPEYERAKAGKNVDVSMSAKIAGDVCTCCGNFAPNSAAYCDCFKNYRGQWHPEYQKMAYVQNPDPNFFDISSVANAADRTARFLEYRFADGSGHTAKVASGVQSLTGSDLAEAYGIVEPRAPMSVDTNNRLRLMKGASYLRRDVFFMKVASSVMPAAQLTDREVESFRACRAPALIRKLAKAKVVLPFHSYVAVFGGMTLKEASESVVMQRAQTHAVGDNALDLAEDMGTPDMESTFVAAHKDTENVGCDDVDQLMDGVADRLGMRDGVSADAPAAPCAHKLAALAIELTPGDETLAKAWAASYGVYKAACLREMETFHGDVAERLLPVLSVI